MMYTVVVGRDLHIEWHGEKRSGKESGEHPKEVRGTEKKAHIELP